MSSKSLSIVSPFKSIPRHSRQASHLKTSPFQQARQRANKKISNKYCTCENYMALSEINRTVVDKQCILKTTIQDLRYDTQEEKLQTYYPINRTSQELPELIQYYKYYSQKTIVFDKKLFNLLHLYQQKRKVIQYDQLKKVLNLSDSQQPQASFNNNNLEDLRKGLMDDRSKIQTSKNFDDNYDTKKTKGKHCPNILDELSLSKLSTRDQNQESFLINRLRNNLSKHIGPSKTKNLSIQDLDKFFDFSKKDELYKPFKENPPFLSLSNSKPKLNHFKPKKFYRQHTHTNTPDQARQKSIVRRQSAKRNTSCQSLSKIFTSKYPYEQSKNKLRRHKNLSMDNFYTSTSTPYINEQRRQSAKGKKISLKFNWYQKEKENTQASKGSEFFIETITDLKNKIKKEKEKLIKANNFSGNLLSVKREKATYSSINNTNQRFTKKNYQKFKETTTNIQ